MKKKLLTTALAVLLMSAPNLASGSELKEEVTAEKLWSVEFTVPVIDNAANLEKIKVFNVEGEEIPTVKQVSAQNTKVVEIIPMEPYAAGEYSIQVSSGIEGRYDYVLEEVFQKDFEVTKSINTNDLTGKWDSLYVHEGALLGINAQFLTNGISNVQVSRLGVQFKGNAQYQIDNGVMEMQASIDNMDIMKVKGKMYIYNSKVFKIVSSTGKEAYFYKK